MSIRTLANNEGGTANLKWQQHQQDYSLLLYGPLGADAVKVSGQPGHVTLETADGKKFNASTPELLLAQQTGWQLPVSNLHYWIRGLPASGPRSMQFDADHHLIHLNQSGWTIDYLRYSTVSQLDMPAKLTLENARIKVKIVINQWQL
jgi:outer membrane lipoprotein LolB